MQLTDILPLARGYDLVVAHTSTPSFVSDVRAIEALKSENPRLKAGLIGAKVAVEADASLVKAALLGGQRRSSVTPPLLDAEAARATLASAAR